MSAIEQKIADIAAKQKADQWAARQEAARQQQADTERNGQPGQQYPTSQAIYDVVGRYFTTGLRFEF